MCERACHCCYPPAPATRCYCRQSADVDFGALREAVDGVAGAAAHGPITQGALLLRLGLGERLQRLVDGGGGGDVDAAVLQERLVGEATRLVHPEQMGAVYKALAVTQRRPGAASGVEPMPPPAF